GSGGAAKIIYVGSFLGMVGGKFCKHPLDLPIERYRSAHHVIKYTGYLGAKFKVGHYFDLFVKNLINFSVWLVGHYVLGKYFYLSSFRPFLAILGTGFSFNSTKCRINLRITINKKLICVSEKL